MSSSAKNVLVIGGDSRIGRALADAHLAAGDRVTRTTRRAVTEPDQVHLNLGAARTTLPATHFDLAYFCAATTSLARCETAQAETWHANVEATFGLMCELAHRGTFFVFFSTNLVFDGSRPQVEASAPLQPACEYGRQKAEVEHRLRRERIPAVTLRLTKVLEHDNPLFAGWSDALIHGEQISPFSDRVMAPVSLDLVARLAMAAGRRGAPGVVQVSATHDISYAEAASHFARALGCAEGLVRPCLSQDVQATTAYSARHTSLVVSPTLGCEAPDPFEAIEFLAAYHGSRRACA